MLINVKAASLNLIDIEISKGYGALIRQAIGTFYKVYKILINIDCSANDS